MKSKHINRVLSPLIPLLNVQTATSRKVKGHSVTIARLGDKVNVNHNRRLRRIIQRNGLASALKYTAMNMVIDDKQRIVDMFKYLTMNLQEYVKTKRGIILTENLFQ